MLKLPNRVECVVGNPRDACMVRGRTARAVQTRCIQVPCGSANLSFLSACDMRNLEGVSLLWSRWQVVRAPDVARSLCTWKTVRPWPGGFERRVARPLWAYRIHRFCGLFRRGAYPEIAGRSSMSRMKTCSMSDRRHVLSHELRWCSILLTLFPRFEVCKKSFASWLIPHHGFRVSGVN